MCYLLSKGKDRQRPVFDPIGNGIMNSLIMNGLISSAIAAFPTISEVSNCYFEFQITKTLSSSFKKFVASNLFA